MTQLLPFRFERLSDDSVVITNELGQYAYLDSHDDLAAIINGETIPTEIHKDLVSKGFIAETMVDAEAHIAIQAHGLSFRYQTASVRPFLFMIVPTLRCDHDCRYCQVSRVHENAQGFDLPMDAIPSIIDRIHEVGRPPFKIEFQGGEPLLAIDFIRTFVESFLARTRDVEFVIATSLSLLDDDIVTWAGTLPVLFSTSLDGHERVHNAQRIHPALNSFQAVEQGIRTINTNLGRGRVGVVTTVTREVLSSPEGLIDSHRHMGLDHLFVRPLSPFGFATKSYSEYTMDEYFDFYESLIHQMLTNPVYAGVKEGNLQIHLRRVFRPGFNSYVDLKSPTGYVLGALVFDFSGRIFGSDEARMIFKTHSPDYLCLGEVHSPIDFSENRSLIDTIASSFIGETPGCDECAFSPYCGSDVMHHLATQGDVIGDKSLSRFCQFQKRMFDLIFRLLKDDETRPLVLGWLDD